MVGSRCVGGSIVEGGEVITYYDIYKKKNYRPTKEKNGDVIKTVDFELSVQFSRKFAAAN